MRNASLLAFLSSFTLFLACGDKDDSGDGGADGGGADGGGADGGGADGGGADGGGADGGGADGGGADGGGADGGGADGGGADGGGADGGGSGDGGTPDLEEYELLADFLVANKLDLPTVMTGWVVDAQTAFDSGLENYFIVDIRTSDRYTTGEVDFEEGHISGAHSVPLADVVTYVEANNTEDLPVLVTCYTGTAAGHAVMALRLNGINAVSLSFGMSAWHSDFDVWTPNLGNAALDYTDVWEFTKPLDLPTFKDSPLIETGYEDGADILASQLATQVLAGANTKSIADVLSAPDDYQIINYWGEKGWTHYGHIVGAYQVTPGALSVDTLDMLDPSRPIVVYCWTGQTASMLAAWLQVMGYDAYALVYSANGLIYDSLESHKFTGSLDFSYVTGP